MIRVNSSSLFYNKVFLLFSLYLLDYAPDYKICITFTTCKLLFGSLNFQDNFPAKCFYLAELHITWLIKLSNATLGSALHQFIHYAKD